MFLRKVGEYGPWTDEVKHSSLTADCFSTMLMLERSQLLGNNAVLNTQRCVTELMVKNGWR